jgi:hypothetical protein
MEAKREYMDAVSGLGRESGETQTVMKVCHSAMRPLMS